MNPIQTQASRPLLALACAAAVLLALTACGKQEDKTVGQSIDASIAKTEEAAKKAEETMAQAAKDAQAAGNQASTTLGEKVDDLAITASVTGGFAKDPDLSAIKISVDTKDGVVTLSGPAPTAAAKDKATDIAKQVKGVTSVNNQLMVKAG
jgi:osmotically-inducible protein OsmY